MWVLHVHVYTCIFCQFGTVYLCVYSVRYAHCLKAVTLISCYYGERITLSGFIKQLE